MLEGVSMLTGSDPGWLAGNTSFSTLGGNIASGLASLGQVPSLALPTGGNDLTGLLINLGKALLVLLVGWLVAIVLSSVVKLILEKTTIDNYLSNLIGGRGQSIAIEKWISTGVFWIVILFALIAFLEALGLQAVSVPLRTFLDEILRYLPRLASAGLLAAAAWLLATVVKTVFSRGIERLPGVSSLSQRAGIEPTGPGGVGTLMGNLLYWLVLLLFLPFILDALNLQGALQPIQGLIDQLLAAVPRLLKTAAIVAIGWLVAKLGRTLVSNALASLGADRLGRQVGLSGKNGIQSLSQLAGSSVFTLVWIFTAISALQELQIEGISGPIVALLQEVLLALPLVFRAVIVLVVAWFAARLVSRTLASFLRGFGFDNALATLGLGSGFAGRSPSQLVGLTAAVGIGLLAAVAAVDSLKVPQLTIAVAGFGLILGKVVVSVLVFLVGLYLANLAYRTISYSGGAFSHLLALAARVAIVVLAGAMALQQLGIAPEIVNLAFGLLLGAAAVAGALAFGLGGRDVANEQLRRWVDRLPNKQ